MKEQGKNPLGQTNEKEIGSLPEKEFREMIVEMIQNLGNRMEKIQETFNKDLEELKGSNTKILGDFNSPITPMDRSSKQKINKETQALSDTIDQRDLINI